MRCSLSDNFIGMVILVGLGIHVLQIVLKF
uniref:Uncharacterized protein n=1 Tax=Rhizophora mucronata TaxID=61149 RepID=A0A2P2QSH2_RHIMU